MAILIYLAKLIICSAVLYGYYYFFLRNKRFHSYNRFYLLSVLIISTLLPFAAIPAPVIGEENDRLFSLLQLIQQAQWEPAVVVYAGANQQWQPEYWYWIVGLLYGGICAALLFRLTKSLLEILRITKKYPVQNIEQIAFYNTSEPGTPFSFFRSIFWNQTISLESKEGQQIFRHEWFHVQQKHSWDILFAELVQIVFFFNPFFYLAKKEIKTIHEFLADNYAIDGNNKQAYALLLVLRAIEQKKQSISHPFFHHSIKRRIAMIIQFKNTRYHYFSKIMALPLFFILFCAFAVKWSHQNVPPVSTITLPVVVKAGKINSETSNNIPAMEITKPKKSALPVTRQTPGDTISISELKKRMKPGDINSLDIGPNYVTITLKNGKVYYVPVAQFKKEMEESKKTTVITGTESIKAEHTPGIEQIRPEAVEKINEDDIKSIELNKPKNELILTLKNEKQLLVHIDEWDAYMKSKKQATLPLPADNVTITKKESTEEANQKSSDNRIVFTATEAEAEYSWGAKGWEKYLQNNLIYPAEAISKKIEGTVVVQFIVNTDGSVTDIQSIEGPAELHAAAEKTIRLSGKWQPAIQNGKKVTAYKKQPIHFRLAATAQQP
jgi:TonB family protein